MATPYVTIGDVAEVLPGFAVKGRVEHQLDGCCQLIQGRHLTPGEPYRYRPQDRLLIDPRRAIERYLVEPGDVLLASRGTANYAVQIADVPPRTIAPATFYILRHRKDLLCSCLPAYLAWALEQPRTQTQIGQIRTSTATPIVQRDDLNAVRIPLPPLAQQQRIAALAELMQRERALLRRLETATHRKHQAIGSALYAGPLREASKDKAP